jgi:NDP-sugar pyrophosphorylase family protein
MILAAGVGSRLDPLTANLPKPMVPIVNRPGMEHILALVAHHGITQVVANLWYRP